MIKEYHPITVHKLYRYYIYIKLLLALLISNVTNCMKNQLTIANTRINNQLPNSLFDLKI